MRTYSLEEAVGILCGRTDDGGVAAKDVRWITARLCGHAEPRLPGYKVGRRWRMTEDDIRASFELLRPGLDKRPEPPIRAEVQHVADPGKLEAPRFSSMTPTSRRRLLADWAENELRRR